MVGNHQIDRLLKTITKDYKGPMTMGGVYANLLSPTRALFYRMYVPLMLRDPHLWYGMELLKGPIVSKATFEVESNDASVAEYVDRQIKNFWMRGIDTALDSLAWGYSGSEVIYDFNHALGAVEFKELQYLHPRDIKPVVKDGKLVAVEIRRARKDQQEAIYVRPPKALWIVHNKKYNRWYGRSRLEGAFESWWEIWKPKGYRDIRNNWFYRHAYQGGVLYYPDGSTQDPETGEDIPNALIATEMLDRVETGASIALPQKTGENRDWEYEMAKPNTIPEGLLEYGDYLRDEMWEGIGVPPEVAKQEGTGSFAGRRVPQQAFYSYIQEIANDICWEFDEQIIRKLVKLTFGTGVDYNIIPVSIMQTLQQEEMGLVTGSVPGEEMEDGEVEYDENGEPIDNEEEQVDEEGNPVDPKAAFGAQAQPGVGGKKPKQFEDRDSNEFNLSEKAVTNQKKKKGKK